MANWLLATEVVKLAVEAAGEDSKTGFKKLGASVRSLMRAPVKTLAAFIAAPFLMFQIIRKTKNPTRRWVALFGFLVAIVAVYFVSGALGFMLAWSLFGLTLGISFLIGTALSVVLSVALSIGIFHGICMGFLHFTQSDVLEYLDTLVSDDDEAADGS